MNCVLVRERGEGGEREREGGGGRERESYDGNVRSHLLHVCRIMDTLIPTQMN